MDEVQIRRRLLEHYGIRVDPEMSKYVLRHLQQARSALAQIPVMGGDARTGIPLRLLVDAAQVARPDRP